MSKEYNPEEWVGKKHPTRSKIVYSQIKRSDIKSRICKILSPFKIHEHGPICMGITNWVMKQEGYCKQVVIDQFLQDTYPHIKQIENLNLSVFLAIVARAVQDNIDQAMLPRTMKAGKNCTWIKAPNFASAMTHDKRDVLYTKEGILATFEDVEKPQLELTLKEASSATSEVTKPSQELVTVELKGDKNTMKESTLSCSKRSPTVDTFSEDKRNMFSYPEPVFTFEETCKGINNELFQNVMSHEEGKFF